jgi:1-acyl-sn-glycerol-3-phosphate acyltransferase
MPQVPSAPLPLPAPLRAQGLRGFRLYKAARLLLAFRRGSQTIARQFPGFNVQQKRHAIQQWAQGVLQVLQVSVHSNAAAPRGFAGLVVANHLSWLDILVIQSLLPGAFVAKTEVRRWPLIGPLAQACATIFVDRRSPRSARSMVDSSVAAMHDGWCVVAFPEGTSSDGAGLGAFHANIFECAIRAGTPVQTLTLRYVDRHTGQVAPAAHFIGEMTLLSSLLRVLGQSSLCAQVHLGECLPVQGHTRKTLAQHAHGRMRALLLALALLAAGTATTAQDLSPPAQKAAQVLNFQDFFQQSAGSKGLHITDTLRQADGQTIRLTGYMVQQEGASLGRFMLTPRPVQMSEHADGDADDLPATWVMVYLDESQKDFAVPHVRGRVELSGVLSVGRLEESDGRVSWVRLQLPMDATRDMNAFEVSNYLHTLQHTH